MKGGGKGKGTVKNSTEHLKPIDDRLVFYTQKKMLEVGFIGNL